MGKYLTFGSAMVLALALICCGGTADAMSAFARKYNVNCDMCHSKIPQLNEFGMAFRKNGFVIPGQKIKVRLAEPQGSKETGTAGTEPVKLPKVEVKLQTEPSDVDKNAKSDRGEEGEAVDTPPAIPPVKETPPTVVYKGSSRDGSVYYTDNPDRKDFVSGEKERSVRRKLPVRVMKTRAAKGTGGKSAAERQPHVKNLVSVAQKAETYRSHEECMERQFVDVPSPASAEEMMDQLTAAELKCASYELPTR
ncbi:hypothetical protein GPICK_05090 [Geobacter pickeringii]|uniref:Cytochrome c domain-containing protein n=2 Tax=Geobacter pickeringii TaxID=345632 RepID=A0A0B5BDP0_9BACT|nr:hypothetical protein GPICK_05090 [Geobacter pickeringii]